jgi:hypothetical protein
MRGSSNVCTTCCVIAVFLGGILNSCSLGAIPTPEDLKYKDACGPIAGVIALKALGVQTSLSETVRRCHWKEGQLTPFGDLNKALNSYRGIRSQAVRLSPKQLCDLLEDDGAVVILAIRKRADHINHAVCAISTDENNQLVHLIDYPELHRNLLIGEVASQWDGDALVVRFSPFYRTMDNFGLLFTPLVVVILGIVWFRSRTAKVTNPDGNRAKEAPTGDSR